MGTSESKNSDSENPEHLFDSDEKKKVNFVFASISHSKKLLTKDQFQVSSFTVIYYSQTPRTTS